MPIQGYSNYDAVGLAELVASGQVTPAELLEEAITRVERVNGEINAVVYPTTTRRASGRSRACRRAHCTRCRVLLKTSTCSTLASRCRMVRGSSRVTCPTTTTR